MLWHRSWHTGRKRPARTDSSSNPYMRPAGGTGTRETDTNPDPSRPLSLPTAQRTSVHRAADQKLPICRNSKEEFEKSDKRNLQISMGPGDDVARGVRSIFRVGVNGRVALLRSNSPGTAQEEASRHDRANVPGCHAPAAVAEDLAVERKPSPDPVHVLKFAPSPREIAGEEAIRDGLGFSGLRAERENRRTGERELRKNPQKIRSSAFLRQTDY